MALRSSVGVQRVKATRVPSGEIRGSMSRTVPLVSWRGSAPSPTRHEPQVRHVLVALHEPAGDDGERAVRGEVVLLEDDLLAEGLGGGGPGCPATRRRHGARLGSRTPRRTGRITRRTLSP